MTLEVNYMKSYVYEMKEMGIMRRMLKMRRMMNMRRMSPHKVDGSSKARRSDSRIDYTRFQV